MPTIVKFVHPRGESSLKQAMKVLAKSGYIIRGDAVVVPSSGEPHYKEGEPSYLRAKARNLGLFFKGAIHEH
jgi:hypothetical protein